MHPRYVLICALLGSVAAVLAWHRPPADVVIEDQPQVPDSSGKEPTNLVGAVPPPKLEPSEPAKLHESRRWELALGEAHALQMLDPQPAAQTITVEFTASAGTVAVLVFKDSDVPGEDDGLRIAARQNALAARTAKAGKLSVEIPAKTTFQVIVREPSARTSVGLTVSNGK